MTLYIVLCDDDADFLDVLYNRILNIANQNNCKCNITKLYSGRALIEHCKSNKVDIIITDIDMPETDDFKSANEANTNGFMAAKQLQLKFPDIEIVFVSAHEELAYQSFRYRPFSFISKRDLQMLDEDIYELFNKIKMRKSSNILFPLDIGAKMYSINVNEIIYFKTYKHYIWAYTVNGKKTSYRCSIKEAYEQLAEAYFIYIHRSYLINCRYIKYFDTQSVIMINDEEISVTRKEEQLKEAQRIFSIYKRRLR